MKPWLTRNRLGLMLLPVALILAVAGSSSRFEDYFWSRGLHQVERADDRGVVDFADRYDDGFQAYPIEAKISLISVKKVDTIPNSFDGSEKPVTKPLGSSLWRVRLHFVADPDIVLRGCHVAIMDRDGNRYEEATSDYQSDGTEPIYLCAPEDTPGPSVQVGSTAPPALEPGDDPRPRSYDTDSYITAPASAAPTSVRVWFFEPKYAELPIS